ncbi:MAG: hypothetical protein FWF59_00715 [Turicibacter sp.]|nr:hypothetical protein [Turicibacter sp.]
MTYSQIKKKAVRVLITVTSVLSLANPLTIPAHAASASNSLGISYESGASLSEIDRLLEVRLSIITDAKVTGVNVDNEVNSIDLQLKQLGAEFLTLQQVHQQFPETKANRELSHHGLTQTFAPRVAIPTSRNNTWISARTTVTVGGTRYNVQRLTVQPTATASNLSQSGSRTVAMSNNWRAGTGNMLNVVAGAVVGSLSNGLGLVLTANDAISAFISGVNASTEIRTPHIVYSWSSTTTAVFTFVRRDDQNDNHQWLSQVSSRTQTVVGFQFPIFNRRQSANGAVTLVPAVVQDSRTITSTPTGHNNVTDAVNNFIHGRSTQLRQVSSKRITGFESREVQNISLNPPTLMGHVN